MIRYESGKVVEPEHILAVDGDYDVVVVGGGMAGLGAGIAAVKAGCKTLLIERESALGGLATIGLVNIPMDYVSGIGMDMFQRLEALDGLWHRNSDPEKHKLVCDRMVKDAGCNLLLVTHVVEAIVRRGVIRGVVVESKAGRQAIMAKRVVDCSGDADAAYFAGCDCMQGRESDGQHHACSLEFRLGGVEWDKYLNSDFKAKDPCWMNLIKKCLGSGDLAYEVDNHLNWMTHVPGRPEHCGMDEVSICFAHSRYCKPLNNRDLTRMYQEGREQADMLWRFIRKHVPGFEKCWLIDTAPLLGVRESRRVVGEYIMTGLDLARHTRFDDVIAMSGHGFDLHNPTGPGNIKWLETEIDGRKRYLVCFPNGFGASWLPEGGRDALTDYEGHGIKDAKWPEPPSYDIPYRSLVPLKVDNLLVAGRCLSADFMGQSGCRLVMCCLTMGEAAGTAMALCLQKGVTPRKLDRMDLQRKLIENGVNLGQQYRIIPGVTQELAPKTAFG